MSVMKLACSKIILNILAVLNIYKVWKLMGSMDTVFPEVYKI